MRQFRPGLAAGTTLLALATLAPASTPGGSITPSYADRFAPVATQSPSPTAMKAPSPLASVSWATGRVDVFAQGVSNTLEQVTYVSGRGWTRAPSLGGSMSSGPTAASTELGKLYVFARGGDGAVWTKRFEGGRWSGWSSLGGAILGEPSVIATGKGRLELFARFADSTLRQRSFRDGKWTADWADLGGELTSPPAAARTGSTTFVVFVRSGDDDAIWMKPFDGAGWQPFAKVGGVATSSPAATSHTDGLVDLYVRGTDGGLYHRWLRNGVLSNWVNLGGIIASGAAPTTWGPGHRVVFVMGTDGKVYQRSFSAGRWAGYTTAPVEGVTRSFEEPLASGVTFRSIFEPVGPQTIQVVTVDLAGPTTIDTALADDMLPGLETTTSMARRHNALVAINGDFALSSGRPVHLYAEDGRLLQSEQTAGRAFAVSKDETAAYAGFPKPVITAEINTGIRTDVKRVNSGAPGFDDLVEYTDEGGTLEGPAGNGCSARYPFTDSPQLDSLGAVVQHHVVDAVQCDGNPMPDGPGDVLSAVIGGSKETFVRTLVPGQSITHRWALTGWPGVFDVTGGNPTLIEEGVVMPSVDGSGGFFAPNPRTGVGYAPGKLFLVVVDGRQPGYSAGMTLRQFANVFLELGARSALNLDGGGSTAMVVDGEMTNRPSDGVERGVATALMVLRGSDPGEQPFAGPTVAPRAWLPRSVQDDGARLLDPASTGGYADALRREGIPLSPGLRQAADRFAAG